MKKVFSIALIILLLLSVGAISAGALAANTTIYLNTNGAAGWNNAYIYGWSGEFSGTFIQMEETPHAGIYSYTFTQATQDGMEHFLFTNKNTWSNQEQTVPLATQAGKNVYRLQEKNTYGQWTGTWNYISPPTPPVAPSVSATQSQTFYNYLDVTLSTNCFASRYRIGTGSYVAFEDGDMVRIGSNVSVGQSVVLTLKGYNSLGAEVASATYTYTKVSLDGITQGTQIFFDNSETKWEHVYISSYNGSYHVYNGDFIELHPISPDSDIYTCILSDQFVETWYSYLFSSEPDATGVESSVTSIENGKNFFVPLIPTQSSGYVAGTWSYMEPLEPYSSVYSTASDTFAVSKTIEINEFYCPGGACYTVNGGEAVSFSGAATFTVGGEDAAVGTTYTVVVTGYNDLGEVIALSTATYTKTGMTTINANIDAACYDGSVYVLLFDGDRFTLDFYEMTQTVGPDFTKNYFTFQFEGAARVIFTTTDDWSTAVELNGDAEPLVEAGATASFDLVYPSY
ncbi:MAG TPA: hypothetical protein IAD32_02095 [Candidatus Scatavimonas merdigallinarum]|uniref:CBM20 domain-containing protein n=1 Tax=Candidatus Scatavimonas merdigallinarum TaxID=2840914 RepID=A0A9D1CV41_9FIRM|nr:hypothetical protein [Candidatus Scatavimonas merdigallinarum]